MKKKEFNKEWNLKIIMNILEDAVKNPDKYEQNFMMSQVCSHLSSFSKKIKAEKQAKHFKVLGKVFDMLDKKNKKKLGRIEVVGDMKAKFKVDKEIEGKRFLEIIDFEKYKGESCTILYQLDGTVRITCSTVSIDVPKRKVKLLEETKPKAKNENNFIQ